MIFHIKRSTVSCATSPSFSRRCSRAPYERFLSAELFFHHVLLEFEKSSRYSPLRFCYNVRGLFRTALEESEEREVEDYAERLYGCGISIVVSGTVVSRVWFVYTYDDDGGNR